MQPQVIDAQLLRKMFLAGAKNLDQQKDWINELNVFPVPDGDTGTNMTLTIMAAAEAVAALEEPTVEEIVKAMSSGSLRGARGNSGVILSQLFRGFSKAARTKESLDVQTLADAFTRAVETAYKAVMKPKEGTILTVARSMAEKAMQCADDAPNLDAFFEEILKEGDAVLQKTPELLPVLKEAGVVDSGGQGLMLILHGAADAYNGKEFDLSFQEKPAKENLLAYAYCLDFVLHPASSMPELDEKKYNDFLSAIGNDILVFKGEEELTVHLRTNDPGMVMQRAMKYGALTDIAVANLKLEKDCAALSAGEKEEALKAARGNAESHPEKEGKTESEILPHARNAFLAVSAGEGLSSIFKSLGVTYIIEGGQTMNPSTDEILEAITKANADNVYILPNNKNIILTAQQAKELTRTCNVFVVPTRTVPQGITAVLSFLPELSPEENLAGMTAEIARVKTGEITYAIRDTQIDGISVKKGDMMGITDDGLAAAGKDLIDVAVRTVEKMAGETPELITIYRGADMTEGDAEKIKAALTEKFAGADVELAFGGQPVYYCIISVE